MALVNSITTEQLKSVVTLAARAPSGDNTQPWTFAWNGQTLTVLFDPSKARHVLDAGLSAAKISLGCVIESVAIAASAYGFSIETTLLELRQDRAGPAAQISFVPNGRNADSLLDALPKRNTDRRVFKKGPMPAKELNEVWSGFDQKDEVQVHSVDSLAPDLFEYIVAAESLVTTHPTIFPDTLQWIRLSEGEITRTEDGMPWRGAGINFLQYPAMRFVRAIPRAFPLVSRAGMRQVYAARVKQLLRSSAGLFCVSLRGQAPPFALVEAGRLAMRLWLRLTQLGYGVQPLTISSLSLYNAKIGVLDGDSVRLFGTRYAEGEGILRKAFSIPDENVPIWMFRTGQSTPLPEPWFTRRRSLDATLQIAFQQ
jgi:hypothetical protein